jgi:hypothetical protein
VIPSNSKVQQTEDEWSWCIEYPFNCTGKGAAMKFLVTLAEFLDEALWVPLLYERSLQNEMSEAKWDPLWVLAHRSKHLLLYVTFFSISMMSVPFLATLSKTSSVTLSYFWSNVFKARAYNITASYRWAA